MHESIENRLSEVRRFRAIIDGVCRVDIVDGQMLKNDQLPATYQPELIQLYFDNQLVNEFQPRTGIVTVDLLTAA